MADANHLKPSKSADILAVGFGTTVAMWTVGYLCRMPAIVAPSWLTLALLMVCMIIGGLITGRFSVKGWQGGLITGLLTAILNMLILGSLLTGDNPNQVTPTMLIWIPGALLAGAALGALSAWIGAQTECDLKLRPEDWTGVFTKVAAFATWILLFIGGVVTTKEAGLAVVDWPNTYGYNMFLYPLSKMTGGIYYEHAHRLYGALVGLTTLALTIHLWMVDRRAWIKKLVFFAFLMVVIQGVMGGLRVTGHFTLSDSPDVTNPNLILAITHGIFGQIFFGVMVAIATATSSSWLEKTAPLPKPSAATDRLFNLALIIAVIVQLGLGSILRHTNQALMLHISMAMVVLGIGIVASTRAIGLYARIKPFKALGLILASALMLQLLLGFGSLIVTRTLEVTHGHTFLTVFVPTTHQALGALILACSVILCLYCYRKITPLQENQD